MIAPARHPRIDEPVKTRRQIFDHTGRLPSPRTGNGRHHPQSAAGPTFMREPCGLTEAERAALDALLTVDPELHRSRFAWLRDYSESPAPSNILELLNRLEYVRGVEGGPNSGHSAATECRLRAPTIP